MICVDSDFCYKNAITSFVLFCYLSNEFCCRNEISFDFYDENLIPLFIYSFLSDQCSIKFMERRWENKKSL